jgi:hypothetical protein
VPEPDVIWIAVVALAAIAASRPAGAGGAGKPDIVSGGASM